MHPQMNTLLEMLQNTHIKYDAHNTYWAVYLTSFVVKSWH